MRDGFRVERHRPSNVGRRLADLAAEAHLDVAAVTTATQTWVRWDPDEAPAPDGFFSMEGLAEDLVERGRLESGAADRCVDEMHEAARSRRFGMSVTMHAVIAVRP